MWERSKKKEKVEQTDLFAYTMGLEKLWERAESSSYKGENTLIAMRVMH